MSRLTSNVPSSKQVTALFMRVKGAMRYLQEMLVADVSLHLRVHLSSRDNSGVELARILQPPDLRRCALFVRFKRHCLGSVNTSPLPELYQVPQQLRVSAPARKPVNAKMLPSLPVQA